MIKALILSSIVICGYIFSESNANQNVSITNQAQTVNTSLSIKAADVIKNLYPEEAYSMFNKDVIRDATKWNRDAINIYCKVTLELCQALLEKNGEKVSKLLLTEDSNNAPELRKILVYYIKKMVEKFNKTDDLKLIATYLATNGGQAKYIPSASLKEYLSHQTYWEDIKELAKPLLESSDSVQPVIAYDIRLELHFDSQDNASSIDVPSASNTQLGLMNQLQGLSNKIASLVSQKNDELKPYANDLEKVKKVKILETEIAKMEKETKKETFSKEIEETQKKVTEFEQQLQTKQKELNSKQQDYQNARSSSSRLNLQYTINQLNDDIKKINTDLAPFKQTLEAKQAELKKIQDPIDQKKQEIQSYNIDPTRTSYIKFINERYDNLINPKLTEMCEAFCNSQKK